MAKNLIYGYIDPRNGHLRYVGKSTLGMHRPKAFGGHSHGHVGRWIESLARLDLEPGILIIEELPDDADDACLDEAERHHIAYWRFVECNLTNLLRGGGTGTRGYRLSPESIEMGAAKKRGRKRDPKSIAKTASANRGRKRSLEARAKMSAASLGRKKSPEAVLKTAAANRGRKQTPEEIERRVSSIRGRKQSPETIEKRASKLRGRKQRAEVVAKRAEAQRGYKQSPEHIKNRFEARKRSIQDQYGEVYPSIKEAAERLGLRANCISTVLGGKYKHTGGYVFTYVTPSTPAQTAATLEAK
jgi:hypothetical protein